MDYETGFINRCLEKGINPEELIKYAQEKTRTVFVGDEKFELPENIGSASAEQFIRANRAKYDPQNRLRKAKPNRRRRAPARRAASKRTVPNKTDKGITNKRTGFRPADSLPSPVKERKRPKFNPADSLPTPGNPFPAAQKKEPTLYEQMYGKMRDFGNPSAGMPKPKAPVAKPTPKPAATVAPEKQKMQRNKPKPRTKPVKNFKSNPAPMIYGDADASNPMKITGAVNKYQEALKRSPGYARANRPVRSFKPLPVTRNSYPGWFGRGQ